MLVRPSPSFPVSSNVQRVVTALLAAPVVVALAYVGGWPFAGLIAGIGVLGQRELYRLAHRVGARPQREVGFVVGILVVATVLRPALWPFVVAGLLLFLVAAPLLLPQEQFLFSFTVTIAGIVYPTGVLGSLVWLREARSTVVDGATAFHLVLLTLLLVWATDVAAYYVGRKWGTRPLAPNISPSKTWAGTVGGIATALVVGVILKVALVEVLAWPHVGAVVVIAGVLGQMGDLLESQLKRSTEVDDSSQLLPGHGGMLDRFDAMAVAAPLICLYLHLVAGIV